MPTITQLLWSRGAADHSGPWACVSSPVLSATKPMRICCNPPSAIDSWLIPCFFLIQQLISCFVVKRHRLSLMLWWLLHKCSLCCNVAGIVRMHFRKKQLLRMMWSVLFQSETRVWQLFHHMLQCLSLGHVSSRKSNSCLVLQQLKHWQHVSTYSAH